jgi:hypothetical protein
MHFGLIELIQDTHWHVTLSTCMWKNIAAEDGGPNILIPGGDIKGCHGANS